MTVKKTNIVTSSDLLVHDYEDNIKKVFVNRKINGKIIKFNPLLDDDAKLVYNFYIIHTDFQFKSCIKFPSIPVFVDQTTTVYPLAGRACLTGAEFLLARNQGCNFKVYSVICIPFSRKEVTVENKETKKKTKKKKDKAVELEQKAARPLPLQGIQCPAKGG